MKHIEQKKVDELVKLHDMWMSNETGGERLVLKGCDLSECDLSDSNLPYINLSGSNLSGSNLSGSNLSVSNLSGSNLTDCDLSGSNLSRSNLTYCNLTDCYLSDCNLSYSNLTGCVLTDSNVHNTIGDGKTILTMQVHPYIINVVDDWLQIGCEGYRIHEWLNFTYRQIVRMDKDALEWWRENKKAVMAFARSEDFGLEY